jgi:hypothetical protein
VAVIAIAVLGVASAVTAGYLLVSSDGPRVYSVPSSIPAACSRNVEAELSRFIQGVPDGSLVRFRKDGCYGQDETLEVTDRRDLTIDGNGSTIKALTDGSPCRAHVRIQGGSNIVIKRLTVRGANKSGFDAPDPPYPQSQCQYGYSFNGTNGAKLLQSRSFDTLSDPIAIIQDTRIGDICKSPPSRGILVDGFHGFNSGRTVAITHADGVTIQDSYFGDLFSVAIDVEPDVGCAWIRNIKILRNRFGRFHHAFFNMYTNIVPSERTGMIEIRDNVTEAEPLSCLAPVNFIPSELSPPGRVDTVTVVGNDLRTRGQGILASYLSRARIEDNTVRKDFGDGCTGEQYPDTFGVWVEYSRDVRVSGNKLVNGPKGGLAGEVHVAGGNSGVRTGR